jgi:integrase/recombinase XerD
MKRIAHPPPSRSGQEALASFEQCLFKREDLTKASIRNYLSDLRHFIAWFETEREANVYDKYTFTPQAIATPTITRYRSYLQTIKRQKPASVNRSVDSMKRYIGWVIQHYIISHDPTVAVKLVEQEGQALVAAVTKAGNLWDHVLIALLLHTGLRVREVCRIRYDQVKLSNRSGLLEIIGKRNKYRVVPLNATARKVLEEYLATLPLDAVFLFPSSKTKDALSERSPDYIIKKYASFAKLPDEGPYDLCHRFGYRMVESVPLHRLAQILGHDSLDTTKLYIQGTKHNLQQAVETNAWISKKKGRNHGRGSVRVSLLCSQR